MCFYCFLDCRHELSISIFYFFRAIVASSQRSIVKSVPSSPIHFFHQLPSASPLNTSKDTKTPTAYHTWLICCSDHILPVVPHLSGFDTVTIATDAFPGSHTSSSIPQPPSKALHHLIVVFQFMHNDIRLLYHHCVTRHQLRVSLRQQTDPRSQERRNRSVPLYETHLGYTKSTSQNNDD